MMNEKDPIKFPAVMKEPRLFPNTVAGVLEALEMSFGKGIYADRVVERLLKQNKSGGRAIEVSLQNTPMKWCVGGACYGLFTSVNLPPNERTLKALRHLLAMERLYPPRLADLMRCEIFR